jgi:hypothetical protein
MHSWVEFYGFTGGNVPPGSGRNHEDWLEAPGGTFHASL